MNQTNVPSLMMAARALLRQSTCPECRRTGMVEVESCVWCYERQIVIEKLLAAPDERVPPEARGARAVVDEQAEDESLWFVAETITETILQKALRRLHAAVEADPALPPGASSYVPDAQGNLDGPPRGGEPDADDMANVGRALMETLKQNMPGYSWMNCPSEVVTDLLNQIHDAKASHEPATALELTNALKGVVGLVQLLTARDDLRHDRDAILSNHRMVEATAVLEKFNG